MAPIDEPASFAPQSGGEERRTKAKAKAGAPAELLSFTVDAASATIVSVERLDVSGARQALSSDEQASLLKNTVKSGLERLVEQAFEAGIDCVLGGGADEEEAETADDAQLRRLILKSLMARGAAQRLTDREALGRTLVRALVEQAARAGGPH